MSVPGSDAVFRLSLVFLLVQSLNSNFVEVLGTLKAFSIFLKKKKDRESNTNIEMSW